MENPYYRYLKLSMEMYQLNFQPNRTKNEGVLIQSRCKKKKNATNLSIRDLYFNVTMYHARAHPDRWEAEGGTEYLLFHMARSVHNRT